MTPKTRWLVIGSAISVLVLVGVLVWLGASVEPTKPDPNNPRLVARGKIVYAQQCASCHGANLEGQPNWRVRLPSGRLPAPPHDSTGHTWHHSDKELFEMVKNGIPEIVPGYQTDMPGVQGQPQRRGHLGGALVHPTHLVTGHARAPAATERAQSIGMVWLQGSVLEL